MGNFFDGSEKCFNFQVRIKKTGADSNGSFRKGFEGSMGQGGTMQAGPDGNIIGHVQNRGHCLWINTPYIERNYGRSFFGRFRSVDHEVRDFFFHPTAFGPRAFLFFVFDPSRALK